MQGSNNRNLQHCREVIRACLNTVEERGDTYVAIHKDEDTECVIIVSMIRTQPILSVIVADQGSSLPKAMSRICIVRQTSSIASQ